MRTAGALSRVSIRLPAPGPSSDSSRRAAYTVGLPESRPCDRRLSGFRVPEGHLDGRLHRGLAALLGPDAPGLSASTIRRLKDVWQGALGKARPLGPALSLFLGRRDPFPAPDGARQTMHPGHHRRRPSGAARNCWQSPTAIARAPSRGASCCSISSCAASRWRPSWPSETGRSASGRPCARATARRANSAAGCTRPATF